MPHLNQVSRSVIDVTTLFSAFRGWENDVLVVYVGNFIVTDCCDVSNRSIRSIEIC